MKKNSKTPKLPAAKATTTAVALRTDNCALATNLTTQYRAVVAATGQMLREAVKFGAMLMELETILGNKQGRDGEGVHADPDADEW